MKTLHWAYIQMGLRLVVLVSQIVLNFLKKRTWDPKMYEGNPYDNNSK